ncbi:hypothetical protein [Neobacillus mesonae]|uniref:hypothetical protein n=1 Tax=Neobacillus mesonae TaxID=1193713 RepID=UPI00203AA8A0|nr:hypothetical protein [Neobacillus mesonae]MCM3567570.1 hypothetical protein [Neobacillus mesonae]
MEQDWKEKFKAEILEDIKKEAKQEVAEEVARIYVETTNYDDERISEKFGVPIYKVQHFREEHQKLEFAKTLEITAEPQYIEDRLLPFQCLPQDMYVRWGKLDGARNMILLGLHAIGWNDFLELLSGDKKDILRKLLNEQGVGDEENNEE